MARLNTAPLIIKRIDGDDEAPHHGGAWKVAYADFMTAMMAFFLLMWIISTADEEKLHGIADYFTPTVSLLSGPGGEGALGGVQMAEKGTMTEEPNDQVVTQAAPVASKGEPTEGSDPFTALAQSLAASQAEEDQEGSAAAPAQMAALGAEAVKAAAEADRHAEDTARFEQVKAEISQAMASSPELQQLIENVRFENTPEGLMIQIIDQDGRSMFASGSSHMEGATRALMQKLGTAVAELPNNIVIAGHTDAVPYTGGGDYGNWELSADRANATRRIFVGAGVQADRIVRISGLADTDPLIPDDPRAASNRRITVHLIYRDMNPAQDGTDGEVSLLKETEGTGTL